MPIPPNPSLNGFERQIDPLYQDSEFKKGLRGAVKRIEPDFRRTVGIAANAVGADEFSRQQYEEAKRIEEEQAAFQAANAPRVGSLREADSLDDYVDFAAYSLGSTAPTMGAMALGGVGGKVLGKALGAGSRASNVTGATAAAAPYASSVGGELSRQIVDDTDPANTASYEDRSMAALQGTAASTALGMAPVGAVANRVLRPGATTAKRVGQGALVGGATEAATEAGEQLVGNVAHQSVNPNVKLADEDALWDYADAAFGGAVVGTPMGATAGLAGAARSKILNRIEDGVDPQTAYQQFMEEDGGVLGDQDMAELDQFMQTGDFSAPRSRMQRRMDDMDADEALNMAYSQTFGMNRPEVHAARKAEQDKLRARLEDGAAKLAYGITPEEDAELAELVRDYPTALQDVFQEIMENPNPSAGQVLDEFDESIQPAEPAAPTYQLNRGGEGWKSGAYGDYEGALSSAQKAKYGKTIESLPAAQQTKLFQAINPRKPIASPKTFKTKEEEVAAVTQWLDGKTYETDTVFAQPPSTGAELVPASEYEGPVTIATEGREVLKVDAPPASVDPNKLNTLTGERLFGSNDPVLRQEFNRQRNNLKKLRSEIKEFLGPEGTKEYTRRMMSPEYEAMFNTLQEKRNSFFKARNAVEGVIKDRPRNGTPAVTKRINVQVWSPERQVWSKKAIDPMAAATAMQGNAELQYDPKDPLGSAVKQVLEGLASVLAHPNYDIRLDGDIDPDTVVYTKSDTGGQITFGDLQKSHPGLLASFRDNLRKRYAAADNAADQAGIAKQGAALNQKIEAEQKALNRTNEIEAKKKNLQAELAQAEEMRDYWRGVKIKRELDQLDYEKFRDDKGRRDNEGWVDVEGREDPNQQDLQLPEGAKLREGMQGETQVDPRAYGKHQLTEEDQAEERAAKRAAKVESYKLRKREPEAYSAAAAAEKELAKKQAAEAEAKARKEAKPRKAAPEKTSKQLEEEAKVRRADTKKVTEAGVRVAFKDIDFSETPGATKADRDYVISRENPKRQEAHTKAANTILRNLGVSEQVRILGTEEALGLLELDRASPNYMGVNGFTVVNNGERVVYVNPALSEKAALEVLGHEIGHIVHQNLWETAHPNVRKAVIDAYEDWRGGLNLFTGTLRELYEGRVGTNLFEQMNTNSDLSELVGEGRTEEQVMEMIAFKEWFSDQVSRWMTTEAKPMTLIEKFFKHVGDVIQDLFNMLRKNKLARPDASVKQFLDDLMQSNYAETYAGIDQPSDSQYPEFSAAVHDNSPDWSRAQAMREISDVLLRSDMLSKEERNALGRAVQGAHVRNQLMEIYAHDPAALRFIEEHKVDGMIPLAYAAWRFGELDMAKSSDSILRKFSDSMKQLFGIISNEENAVQIMREVRSGMEPGRQSVLRRRNNETVLQKAREFTEKVSEPAMRVAHKVFLSAEGQIRATDNAALMEMWRQFYTPPDSPGGAESYFAAKNTQRAFFEEKLHEIYDGQDEAFGQRVVRILQKEIPEKEATKEEMKVVNKTYALLRGIYLYAQKAGVKVGDLGPKYFPRVWDAEYVTNHMDEFKEMLVEKYSDQLKSMKEEYKLPDETSLEDVAGLLGKSFIVGGGEETSAIENVMREMEEAVDGDPLGWPKNNHMKERALKWLADEDAAPFLSKNLGEMMSSYINQMVKRSEYNRRVGIDSGRKTVQDYLADARETGASDADIERATRAMKAAMGTLGIDINPGIHRAQGTLMVLQNWMLLGLATLTSLVDPVGIAVRGDMDAAWTALKTGLKEVKAAAMREDTDLSKMAQSLGINELHNTLDALGYEYGGYYVTGKARRWNDRLFTVNLLSQWTRVTRTMALAGGKGFLEKHGGYDFNEHSARYMNELGLRRGDVKLDENGKLVLLSSKERIEASESDRAELERDERVRAALNRFVDESILRPDAAQRPIWASDPHWMLVFHLKAFMYSFHERILRRVGHEMMNGRYNAALALAGYVPAMFVAEGLRNAIQGDDMDDSLGEDAGLFDTTHYLAQKAGLYGPWQMVFDIQKGFQYGDSPFSTTGGPTVEHVLGIGEAVWTDTQADDLRMLERSMPLHNVWQDWF